MIDLRVIQGGMAKTEPKGKRSGDAIVPVATKATRTRAKPADDQRGAIVELLMQHAKLREYRRTALSLLPRHGVALSESDLRGVRAILESELESDDAFAALRVFFARKPPASSHRR